MGEAKGPVGTASVGHEGHERRPGVPAQDEGRVRGHRESAPGRTGAERRGAQARPRLYLFLCLSFVFSFVYFFLAWWGSHHYRSGRSAGRGKGITAAAMALWAACSGITNKRSHTPPKGNPSLSNIHPPLLSRRHTRVGGGSCRHSATFASFWEVSCMRVRVMEQTRFSMRFVSLYIGFFLFAILSRSLPRFFLEHRRPSRVRVKKAPKSERHKQSRRVHIRTETNASPSGRPRS